MAIFGAQGIRDAMAKSYHKHVCKFREQPLPSDTTLHQTGLYGALSSRYAVSLKSIPEVAIWAELAPFKELPTDDGIQALAEYIVYKEMPQKSNIVFLANQIKKGMSLLNQEEREGWELMAKVNNAAWVHLYNEEI